MARHIDKVLSIMIRVGHPEETLSKLFAIEKRRVSFLRGLPLSVEANSMLSSFAIESLTKAGLNPDTVTDMVPVRGGEQKLGRYLKAKLNGTMNDELIQLIVNEVRTRSVTVDLSRSFLDILGCSDEGIVTTFRSCYSPDGRHSEMPLHYAMLKESCIAVVRREGSVIWRSLCIYDGNYLSMSKVYSDGSIVLSQETVLEALGMPSQGATVPNVIFPATTEGIDTSWWGGRPTSAATPTAARRNVGDENAKLSYVVAYNSPSDLKGILTKKGLLVICKSEGIRAFVPMEKIPSKGHAVVFGKFELYRTFQNTVAITTLIEVAGKCW